MTLYIEAAGLTVYSPRRMSLVMKTHARFIEPKYRELDFQSNDPNNKQMSLILVMKVRDAKS